MNNTGVIDPGFIDKFLDTFTRYIDSGFGLLGGEVAFLVNVLIAIDITIAALFWTLSAGEDILVHLIKKTLYVGFFAYLIGNFKDLAKVIFESFSGLGLKAAGSTLTTAHFLQPGWIATTGIDAGWPIVQAAGRAVGWNPATWFEAGLLMIGYVVVIGSFVVMAIQLFVALIEFKLTTLAGFILVPFGLFGGTAFLAERVLGNVIASGVKILVLAVIVGIGAGLFGKFTFSSSELTWSDVLAISLAALTLVGLSIYGPGIATGVAAGAPQLGAGAAAGTGSTVFGAAAVGWATLRTGGSLAGGAYGRVATRRASGQPPSPGGGSGPSAGSGSPPPWAQRMRRGQAMSSGISRMAQALRSGDSAGPPTSVNLRGGDT